TVAIDPHANAPSGLGVQATNGAPTIYQVLVVDMPLADSIRPGVLPFLDLVPSAPRLNGADVELVPMLSRETRLKASLEPVVDKYDYIVIDCPPSLGLLTINTLTASDSVLIPIQCEYYALEGLSQLSH